MPDDSVVRARIDEATKAEAAAVLSAIGLTGDPGSNPSGSGASVIVPQSWQCPAYCSTRVTTGLTFGRSSLSWRAASR